MYAKFDMWVLWQHQHLLNFLGKKFGVTKEGVLQSLGFWLVVAHISMAVSFFPIESVAEGIFTFLWFLIMVLFVVFMIFWAWLSCRSNEHARKLFYDHYWVRLLWWIFMPLDLIILIGRFIDGSINFINWGSGVDTFLSLAMFYFSSCVKPPPKERKEQFKPAHA